MTSRVHRLDWALFGLLSLAWGSSYLFIKIGIETLAPFTLIAWRLLFGGLVLGAVLRLSREPLPRERATYAKLVVMALFNIVIPFSLITWGERYIDSSLAAILQATTPLFTIVIASLALSEEAITVNRLVGLCVGFGGVVILLGRGLGGGEIIGELAIAASSLSYAAGNVFVRTQMRGLRPMIPAFFQVGIAFVIVTGLALVFEGPAVPARPEALFAVVWLGVLGSALAYLIYFRLVHILGPTRMSLITYLMPIVAIGLGVAVRGEVIGPKTIVGTAVILGGVGLVNSRFGARRLYGRASAPPTISAPGAAGPGTSRLD